MEVANTPANYHTHMATITAVKGFIIQAPGVNYAINVMRLGPDRILHQLTQTFQYWQSWPHSNTLAYSRPSVIYSSK
jgi:hypothetical protein